MEKPLKPANAVWQAVQTVALVSLWYAVNVALVIANKWLISETGYRQTSMITLVHMVTSALATCAMMGAGFFPWKHINTRQLAILVVLSASFTVSVAACMASLAFLPASFVQAMGSTTPVFTAILALAMQGRREANMTYVALVPVVSGIAMASGGEPQFNVTGLVLQIISCSSRSFKTVLQAMLLVDERDRFHPITLLAYTSAISAVLLVPLVALVEPRALAEGAALAATNAAFLPLLAFSCAMAFLVNLTNFIISKQLGALTLQVLGNFKNVVAAAISIAVFANPTTALGLGGYAITTAGVIAYTYLVKTFPYVTIFTPVAAFIASVTSPRPPKVRGISDAENARPLGGMLRGEGAMDGREEREPLLRAAGA